MLRSRIDLFEMTVAGTAEYLRGAWPDELADVHFEVGTLPIMLRGAEGVDRWTVSHEQRRILLYRLPIERLARLHRHDEIHLRMLIESCVLRAVPDLLGKAPWDLAPDRFRHF